MSNIKRAMISLSRQPVKSSIFLLLVFILGILISGAISVHHAIMNTNQNLKNRMPAIALVEYNCDYEYALKMFEASGEWPSAEINFLTREIIHEIGNLPQVRLFDYAITIAYDVIVENLEPWIDPLDIEHRQRTLNGFGVELDISGVATVDFLNTRSDFLELVSGRGFTEEELMIKNDQFPVLIASGFAQTNGLLIGSIFEVRVLIRDIVEREDGSIGLDWNSEPTLGTVFPLEVIGIFEPLLAPLNEHSDVGDFVYNQQASQLQHRMYVSNLVAQEMFNELVRELPLSYRDQFIQSIFLLNDSLDSKDFAEAVSNISGNWRAVDYSRGFNEISIAMTHLQDIADTILIMASITTITILSLLVLLFLNDRKQEIGIYLALGASKRGIVLQIIVEVTVLALIGMSCALFIGNIVAENISFEMLRQELINPRVTDVAERLHWLEAGGYRFSMTHDEMLVAYEVRLGINEIIWFYIVGLGIVLIATILPIAKIVKTNPKKVLL